MQLKQTLIVTSLITGGVLVFSGNNAASAMTLNKQVKVQPIQVCNDAGADCAKIGFFEAETDKIWAQAGIDIKFLNSLQLNGTDFLSVDIGQDEHVDLYQAGNDIAGNPVQTMFINMYFVDDIIDTDGDMSEILDEVGDIFGLGCGAPIFAGVCGGETGVIIADEVFSYNAGIGRLDTIAHEIGHVLGLTHNGFGAGGAENFMTSGGSRSVPSSINDIAPDGLNLDQMTQAQIDEVLTNDPQAATFVKPKPVPEPSAILALASMGVLGLYTKLKSEIKALKGTSY